MDVSPAGPIKIESRTNDAEDYDFENDALFKFENGTVSVVDIVGCRVMKDFMVNGTLTPCGGTCTGVGIDSEDGSTLIEICYDDSDKEDLSYEEFIKIKTCEESTFMCGCIPDMVD